MKLEDHISKWCTYGEAIHSDTASRLGISNIPNEQELEAMQYVANEVFDIVRDHFNTPLTASSFFRSKELNSSTPGASKSSKHMNGEAIDMFLSGRNAEIFKFLFDNKVTINFDQLIWEYGTTTEPAWVHCSKTKIGTNRQDVLRAYHEPSGNIRYIPFDLY